MSSPEYAKATCPACYGHVEYPVAAAGTEISCPHCRASMALPESGKVDAASDSDAAKGSLGLKAPMLAIMVALITATAILVVRPGKKVKPDLAEAATNSPTASSPAADAEFPLPEGWQRPVLAPTGDLEMLGFKMESQPGTSLKHVIGLVTNRSAGRYFGVKVEFNMIDAQGSTVGKAVDQTTSLMGRSSWHFRALSVGGKPEKASAARLNGDKE